MIGPSIAGLIIIASGYSLLFWIDGLTCIVSILLFSYLVKEQKAEKKTKEDVNLLDSSAAIFRDKPYWIFLTITFLIGVVFFQLFSTLPLYHKEQFNWAEFQTGMLFFINGIIIILFEMPMVHVIELKGIKEIKLITISSILFFFSFGILLFNSWSGILVISMVIVTIAEMVGFPYTNAFAMKRAKKGNEGRYMAMYTMAFALAHIISPKLGLDIVAKFGYQVNFMVFSGIGVLAIILSFWLKRVLDKEEVE